MKHRILAVLTFLFVAAVPAVAQERFFDITGYASWVDTSSEGTFEFDDASGPLDVNFDGTMGYGVAANVFFGDRISTEFAVTRVENEIAVRPRAVNNTGNTTAEMMPLTAVLQFHFAPNSFIDPYVGGGVAYVLFDDVDGSDELDNIDFESIDFEDDYGFVINAGLGIRITENFGLTLDGKYVPLESSATARRQAGDQEATFDINPVILSAGVSLRF